MVLNISKKTLDGMQLGYRETRVLSLLANNYCITAKEIANHVFDDKWIDCKHHVYNTIQRLRAKGLHIKRLKNNGYRLIETIYIDY